VKYWLIADGLPTSGRPLAVGRTQDQRFTIVPPGGVGECLWPQYEYLDPPLLGMLSECVCVCKCWRRVQRVKPSRSSTSTTLSRRRFRTRLQPAVKATSTWLIPASTSSTTKDARRASHTSARYRPSIRPPVNQSHVGPPTRGCGSATPTATGKTFITIEVERGQNGFLRP